eukprot:CFRG0179T1
MPDSNDRETLLAEEGRASYSPQAGKHPVVTMFHIGFRLAALLTYILCTWFNDGFVLNFVIIVLLLACDFWYVKNISGRLLVGLRWWNHVAEDGASSWVFESRKDTSAIDPSESNLFWWSLYIFTGFWGFLLFTALIGFHFQYMVIVTVALFLNLANVYGYTKAQKDSRANNQQEEGNMFSNMASSFMARSLWNQATASMTGTTGTNAARG